jgi:c-di-GMP-binding flagellar brake protein YcgR
MTQERRKAVRLKPTPELPARAVLAVEGPVAESLTIFDVSVGGMATSHPGQGGTAIGRRMTLKIDFAVQGEHSITCEIRWASPQVIGIAFLDMTPEATQAVRRYVADLLERGAT